MSARLHGGIGCRNGPWRAVPAEQRVNERVWEIRVGDAREVCCSGIELEVAELAWSCVERAWILRSAPQLDLRTIRLSDPPTGRARGGWPMVVPATVFDRARGLLAVWAVEAAFDLSKRDM